MDYKWKFPLNNGGQINGIANAGIETFNGRLIQSIARENCQNSLDAIREGQTCTTIRFTCKKINSSLFPGRDEFAKSIDKACEYWKGNEKASNFLKTARSALQREQMDVLIISDYNTTGLTGPFTDDINSPWSSLTKLDGGATKSGNTGGSFGIGKHAPFANSAFRTIFYRTKNINDETAAQGIARIISYPEDLDNAMITMNTGVGYFGNENGNKPVEHIEELDKIYQRNEIGTDVFVFGFYNESSWKREIIEEILKNFIVSIYNGRLKVFVDETEISKETLDRSVNNYIKDKNGKDFKSCYSTYLVLTSPKTQTIEKPFHGMGSLELKLLIDPTLDLDRKILRVRKTGMKLFSRNSISKVIMYSAILELKGDTIGSYFLKLEPPTHDKWEHDRIIEHKQEAKSFIKEIEDWEEKIIQEKGWDADKGEISVEDLGEYLSFEGESASKIKKEDLNDSIEKILITSKKAVDNTLGRFYPLDGQNANNKEKESMPGELSQEGTAGVRTLKGTRQRKTTQKHTAIPKEDGVDISVKPIENQNKKEIDSLRIFKVAPSKYKMTFFAPQNISKGNINVLTIGENNKSKRIIVKNSSAINNIANVETKNNSIEFTDIKESMKVELFFEIGDDRNYAMEVEVYEHI